MKKKLISIIASCLNEEKNIEIWYKRIIETLNSLPNYDYEIVISDNNSQDATRAKLVKLAKKNKKLKVLFNQINYGHILSPYNSILNSSGDIIISIATDLEDPPELIKQLVETYEKDNDEIVLALHPTREITFFGKLSRSLVLFLVDLLVPGKQKQLRDFTGFFLMTRKFKDLIISFNEPYPYFRGLIVQTGHSYGKVFYDRGLRMSGESKTSILIQMDLAILAVVSQSTKLLRFVSIFAFIGILFSFLVFLYYGTQKLLYWDTFQAGQIPVLLLILFLFSMVFLILGIISEYLSALYVKVKGRPVVLTSNNINID